MLSASPKLVFVPLVLALAACAIESGHPHDHGTPQQQQEQPVTVVVDTNQTMGNTPGGEGLGIFVTYNAGGHWRVWWTCDTNISGLPCDFDVQMSGAALTNSAPTFSGSSASSDSLDSSAPNVLVAQTHTTTSVDAVTFDAQPGADMTVDVTVSGLRDGRFFFFVQNGQVNGNFQGKLSDPLIFEPATP